MYLIVNQQHVHRIQEPQVWLGLSTDEITWQTPPIGNSACCLIAGLSGIELVRQGRLAVQHNGTHVAPDQKLLVSSGDILTLGNHTIEVRAPEPEGQITRVLRKRAYEMQAELHHEILNRLRLSNFQVADDKYRQQVETELDRLLSGADPGAEFVEFLSAQALREMLLNQANGYAPSWRKEARQALLRKHAALLRQLSDLMGLQASEDLQTTSERIEVLLTWALQAKKSALTPVDKQTLALSLLREQLLDLIFGLGPLDDLINAPDISEVMVLPGGEIYVERSGRLQSSGRRMPSAEVARLIIERIVAREGRRIDATSPMVDVKLADGSRGNFIIEPISLKGPALTIRRFSARRLTIDDLLKKKTITSAVANFLRGAIAARKNIIISGGTGSGKTTLLNILAAWIAPDERIVTVEDTAEISLPQEHVVTLQARPANLEGKGAIAIRDLVRNTLRMRPDRIIVGECRGGETLDMLQAMNTGHDGSLTTIHANTPWDAARRLEVLAMEADGIALPVRALREQIGSAIDLIVQVERFRDGARRITSVCEVVGFDDEEGTVILEEIFQLRRNRKKIKLTPMELEFTGYVPLFIEALLATKTVTLDSLF